MPWSKLYLPSYVEAVTPTPPPGSLATVSPLHTNLQVVSFKEANVCSHVQAHKLVHVSGVHCHVCASSTSNCGFIYFTVLYKVQ